MNDYFSINLKDILDSGSEESATLLLRSFSCPLNADIEEFAREKAIDFSKKRIAQTHLVFASDGDHIRLCGFYALTLKLYTVSADLISNTLTKKLLRFGVMNQETNQVEVPAPLIAQIGKNYTNNANELIDGDLLLDIACRSVRAIQSIVGGGLVYLECERKEKLINFYKKNGFFPATLNHTEEDTKLLQMIRFL